MSRAQPASDYVSRSNTGMKNRIINGGMDIAQRGTSFTGWTPANSTYALDRFRITSAATSAVITVTQQADAPSNNEFQNSFRVAVTTADTSIAAGDVMVIDQSIEGYNMRDLIGRTFTTSFWVRSSKTGIHCLAFQNGAADRSYIAEYTIIAANTWEYKTITVTVGLLTAGTWNYTNGVGLTLRFALAGGTTFQSTAGAWNTGNFTNTANQVNCLDTIGNIFAITGVQLEVGAIATQFEHRPFGAELALCQRYFCKSYEYFDAPGTITDFGSIRYQATSTAGESAPVIRFPVNMRIAVGTTGLLFYNPISGTSNSRRNLTAGTNETVTSTTNVTAGTTGFCGQSLAHTAASIYAYHYTASAEL